MAVLQVANKQVRSAKIAAMQALVDEALADGDGTMTVEDIIAAAEEADGRHAARPPLTPRSTPAAIPPAPPLPA